MSSGLIKGLGIGLSNAANVYGQYNQGLIQQKREALRGDAAMARANEAAKRHYQKIVGYTEKGVPVTQGQVSNGYDKPLYGQMSRPKAKPYINRETGDTINSTSAPEGYIGSDEYGLILSHKKANKADSPKAAYGIVDGKAAMFPDGELPEGATPITKERYNDIHKIDRSKKSDGESEKGKVDPTSFKYKKEKLDYIDDTIATMQDSGQEFDVEQAKAMAGTAFDAHYQEWKPVNNKKLNINGYKKPDGTIVDLLGNPVKETPKANPTPTPDPKDGPSNTTPVSIGDGYPIQATVTKDSGFKSMMDNMLSQSGAYSSPAIQKAIKIVKGQFDQKSGKITFKPENEADMKKKILELSRAGIQFDAAKNQDGSLTLTIKENEPIVKVTAP